MATNLDQLLTSKQAKNQCQKVLSGHFTQFYSTQLDNIKYGINGNAAMQLYWPYQSHIFWLYSFFHFTTNLNF